MSDEFYLLGYWGNAYRANDKEYYWSGPFETRKDALASGKRRQKEGQPKTFIDWCGGGNKVFSSKEGFVVAANKVGMNPKFWD